MKAFNCIKVLLILQLSTSAFAAFVEFFSPSSTFYEISRKHSFYKLLKPRYSSKVINLASSLSFYSTCLVNLINYENADIMPLSHPVVQSRYDIIQQKFLVYWNVAYSAKTITTSKRTRMVAWDKIPKRNESFPWCMHEWPDFECPDIPFQSQTPKIKPWLCEAHFYLFPSSDPMFYYRRVEVDDAILHVPASLKRQFWVVQPEMIHGKDIWHQNWRLVTSLRHDVLVHHKTTQVLSWVSGLTRPPMAVQESTLSNQQFLLAYTEPRRINRWMKLKLVEVLHWALLCIYCHPTQQPFHKIKLGTPINRNELLNQIRKLSSSFDHVTHGILPLGRPMSSSLHTRDELLPELEDLYEVYELLNTPELSVDEARWELETRVLGSVFKNITFVSFMYGIMPEYTERFKERPKHPPLLVILQKGRLDQMPFSMHEQALKFVSCGEPNLERFDFLQITSVYDSATWLAIVATLFTISFFTTITIEWKAKTLRPSQWKNVGHRLISSVLTFFAPLVEDSDSIAHSYFKNTGFRYLLGSYFLIIVIISNAFKYRNISDLTLPLARLPFDTYESLIANNFSIYSRTVYLGGWANLKNLVNLYEFGLIISFFLELGHRHQEFDFIRSEVFGFVHAQEQVRSLWMHSYNFSRSDQELLNATQMLPFGFRLFQGKDETCTLYGKNSTCDIFKINKCNKTALFLPDVDANIKFLETVEGNEDRVFLSKNSSVSIRFGFQFFGWVHPRILKRLAGLQESFIMEWWTKFMVDFVPKIKAKHLKGKEEFKSTSIYGKILTVFVLWFGGFLICCLVFFLEHCSLKRAKWICKSVCQYTRKIFVTLSQINWIRLNRKYKSRG